MVQYFLTCELCDGLLMTGGEEKHLKHIHNMDSDVMSEEAIEEMVLKTFRLIRVPSDAVSDGAN